MRRFLLALPLLAVLSFASSCSDSNPFVPTIEGTNFAPSLGIDLAAFTKTASGLYYRDVVVGSGALVADTGAVPVRVQYAGFFRSGVSFDAGSFDFTVGSSGAIAGMEEGLRGMRVGGQRQLIIPPHLGYGGTRYGSIPPNSILVFNVTLTNIF